MRTFKYCLFFIVGCVCSRVAVAYAPVNFNKPFDVIFRTERWLNKKGQVYPLTIGTQLEFADTTRARNIDSDTVNVLERYQDTQSSIAMLYGAQAGSTIDNLLGQIANATDDGIRGNFKLIPPLWLFRSN